MLDVSRFASDGVGSGVLRFLITQMIITNTTWTCPRGISTVTVRIFGAGGSGGNGYSNYGGGGGGGGHMSYKRLNVVPGTGYPITIGAPPTSYGQNGGTSSFGALLSANGGSAGATYNGGSGGSGGGSVQVSTGGTGGNGSYGGGGGSAGTFKGGDAGLYGGGGGSGTGAIGTGGLHGGNGGSNGSTIPPQNGTNTIGMDLEFTGQGLAGDIVAGCGSGGGGYGGTGGTGSTFNGAAGGAGGGFGGNGGNTNGGCGGGGGYGSNGGSLAASTYVGQGGGGYGPSELFANGGNGYQSAVTMEVLGKPGICIIQYYSDGSLSPLIDPHQIVNGSIV